MDLKKSQNSKIDLKNSDHWSSLVEKYGINSDVDNDESLTGSYDSYEKVFKILNMEKNVTWEDVVNGDHKDVKKYDSMLNKSKYEQYSKYFKKVTTEAVCDVQNKKDEELILKNVDCLVQTAEKVVEDKNKREKNVDKRKFLSAQNDAVQLNWAAEDDDGETRENSASKLSCKRKRVAWTPEEEEFIRKGFRKYGRQWSKIRDNYAFQTSHLNSVSIKDKFRNMMKKGDI
ncbi:myb-like protein F [Xenia sp. Carnegie-2017]|uniref:myb-like protein F n=1 Tax=Xenia sp. Carnegie-2017 TaxID=2897299 RepID=UPI001F04E621|nr:myb-like protein F [Xenia sp. Carnegie-2017]XP_046848299.1 myb-like protein F [Xenia sp. Carnegie-2017]XP_046848300.1 myb-like protein F [Xenia sp. Carnegie-2017]XP_046848301.1 myb-like protein F [Xenia sp. Carnegie-2017]XP_046848302.1 myb-like protein F [Xenia sp. Carnegie-2017]